MGLKLTHEQRRLQLIEKELTMIREKYWYTGQRLNDEASMRKAKLYDEVLYGIAQLIVTIPFSTGEVK